MVMRSFRISRLTVMMKSKAATIKLKERVQRRYGHFLTLRVRGRTLYITGEGIGDYKVRNWIYHIAKEN